MVTLWVAAMTEIGPTVVVLSHTHGVHLGDAVVGVGAFTVAGSMVALAAALTATEQRPRT